MRYTNQSLLLLLLFFVSGCAHHPRHPLTLTSEDQLPTKTPFDSDGLARVTYHISYSYGYEDTITRLTNMKYIPAGLLAPAERNGYVDGVAAAFDAWLEYSRTNVVNNVVKPITK